VFGPFSLTLRMEIAHRLGSRKPRLTFIFFTPFSVVTAPFSSLSLPQLLFWIEWRLRFFSSVHLLLSYYPMKWRLRWMQWSINSATLYTILTLLSFLFWRRDDDNKFNSPGDADDSR
jgi:hypothetical protein